MRDLNLLAPDLAHEFGIVIARHTQRAPRLDRFHHQAHDLGTFGTAINEVAEKHELAPSRMTPGAARLLRIAQHAEQDDEFVVATMNVADDVEGTMLLLFVVPQRLAFN